MTSTNLPAPSVLVTGGAGYIGSHAVMALEQAGYQVVILDSLEYGHQELVEKHLNAKLVHGNTADRALLDQRVEHHNFAVMSKTGPNLWGMIIEAHL